MRLPFSVKTSLLLVLAVAPGALGQRAAIVKDIRPGAEGSSPGVSDVPASGFVELDGRAYFLARDGEGAANLWRTDGTFTGTVKVVELGGGCLPGAGASEVCFPANLVTAGGALFFANLGSSGVELWRSDGTPAGTRIYADINDGRESSLFYPNVEGGYFGDLTPAGTEVYCVADDGRRGQSLWRTDAATGGMVFLKNGATRILGAAGSQVYFTDGPQLWTSDGSVAGTRQLNTFAGGISGEAAALGSRLIFSADDGRGFEPWRAASDGVEILGDFFPGAQSSIPVAFVTVGDQVFFSARDDVHGFGLWKTDGTRGGTVLVKDPYAGLDPLLDVAPTELTSLGGRLYFAAEDGASGLEPWVSDGTTAGTRRLADIRRGSSGSITPSGEGARGRFLAAAGSTVWFNANDGLSGAELWATNGTAAGTRLAADVLTGPGSGDPAAAVFVAGNLVFSATDGGLGGLTIHGQELHGIAVGEGCAEEVIVDNGQSGTQSSGIWSTSRGSLSFGGASVWARASSSFVPTYTFEASLVPGVYEVLEWHSSFSTRTTGARHLVTHAGGTTAVLVDQSVGGGVWNSLGTFTFADRGRVVIRAEDSARSTNADAVRFVCRNRDLPLAVIDGIAPRPARTGESVCFSGQIDSSLRPAAYEWTSSLQPGVILGTEPSFCRNDLVAGTHQVQFRVQDASGAWSPPSFEELIVEGDGACDERIVDNATPGATSFTGKWSPSPTPSPFGGSSVWAKPPGADRPYTYTFSITLPAGNYEVFEWHTVWSSRARAVEHVLTSGGSSHTALVDQSVRGGQWNSLGVHSLEGPTTVTIRATDTQRSTNADAIRFVCR